MPTLEEVPDGGARAFRDAPGAIWKRGAICLLAASALLVPAAYLRFLRTKQKRHE